jgi:hypothetical protein
VQELVSAGKVQTVVVTKLDRLTRSVKDLCSLLALFEKRKVALVSVAESLDTGSAAGRLVITIMGAVSQWERSSHTLVWHDPEVAKKRKNPANPVTSPTRSDLTGPSRHARRPGGLSAWTRTDERGQPVTALWRADQRIRGFLTLQAG